MKYFILAITLSFSYSAFSQSYYSCFSQCLGLSTYDNSLLFLGRLTTSAKTLPNAWHSINKICESKAKHYGVSSVLVNGIFSFDRTFTTSYESWSEYEFSSVSSFRYREVSELSSQGEQYFSSDNLKLKIEFAHPKKSCILIEGEIEEVEEYYQGDLPVLG